VRLKTNAVSASSAVPSQTFEAESLTACREGDKLVCAAHECGRLAPLSHLQCICRLPVNPDPALLLTVLTVCRATGCFHPPHL
jgi:hypothetical protein